MDHGYYKLFVKENAKVRLFLHVIISKDEHIQRLTEVIIVTAAISTKLKITNLKSTNYFTSSVLSAEVTLIPKS